MRVGQLAFAYRYLLGDGAHHAYDEHATFEVLLLPGCPWFGFKKDTALEFTRSKVEKGKNIL